MAPSRELLIHRGQNDDLGLEFHPISTESGLPATVWKDKGQLELDRLDCDTIVPGSGADHLRSLGGGFKGLEIPAELVDEEKPKGGVVGPAGVAHEDLSADGIGPEGESSLLGDLPVWPGIIHFQVIGGATVSEWVEAVGKVQQVRQALSLIHISEHTRPY